MKHTVIITSGEIRKHCIHCQSACVYIILNFPAIQKQILLRYLSELNKIIIAHHAHVCLKTLCIYSNRRQLLPFLYPQRTNCNVNSKCKLFTMARVYICTSELN